MVEFLKLLSSLVIEYGKSNDRLLTVNEMKRSLKPVTKYRELITVRIPSIYRSGGKYVDLPSRMARFTQSTRSSILSLNERVLSEGGILRLSDGFRSSEMQLQAHLDWKTGKKKAYSPPPGSSGHEGGVSIDVDTKTIDETLSGGYKRFWDLAHEEGFSFIIPVPDINLSEAWHLNHFDEGLLNLREAVGYKEMIRHAIRRIGGSPDDNVEDDEVQLMQGLLASLGYSVGDLDGIVGKRTYKAIADFMRSYKSVKSSEVVRRCSLLIDSLGFGEVVSA